MCWLLNVRQLPAEIVGSPALTSTVHSEHHSAALQCQLVGWLERLPSSMYRAGKREFLPVSVVRVPWDTTGDRQLLQTIKEG